MITDPVTHRTGSQGGQKVEEIMGLTEFILAISLYNGT